MRKIAVLILALTTAPSLWAETAGVPGIPEATVTPTATGSPTPTPQATATAGRFMLDAVVVTANRRGVPLRQVGGSLTVLTEGDLERGQQATVAEALRGVPALDVVNTGGPGKSTSLDLRGAGDGRTKVLVDGIEVNDPMSTGRTFDAADLTVDNVERVEVLRGPQSALYGPEALGGIVQVFTKTGQGPLKVDLLGEGGSYGEYRSTMGLSGGQGKFDYSGSLSRLGDKGFPSAPVSPGQTLPQSPDGNRESAASAKLGFRAEDWLSFSAVTRFNEGETHIDNGSGIRNDPNHLNLSRSLDLRFEAQGGTADGTWLSVLGASQALHRFEDRNDPDADHPFDFLRNPFYGRVRKVDWLNHFQLPHNVLTAGFENQEESGDSSLYSESLYGPYSDAFNRETSRLNGWLVQDQAAWKDRLFVTAGARLDKHDLYGSHATWRLAGSWTVPGLETLWKATLGTGWKAPSLYQRFSAYGNPNLEPETSRAWDFGFEQPVLGRKAGLGADYFHSRSDEFLDFDNVNFVYLNYHRVRIQGVEMTGRWSLPKGATLRSAFTWTDARNGDTGELLPRRAVRQASLSVDGPEVKRVRLGADLRWVGPRQDIVFPDYPATAYQVRLADYWTATLRADVRVAKGVKVYGRVENLTDRRYEEVLGYLTARRSFYAGTRLEF